PDPAGRAFQAFSPDARWMLTMWQDGRLSIWKVGGEFPPRGEPLWPNGLGNTSFATIAPDGPRVLIAGDDGTVWLGDIAAARRFRKLVTHPGAVRTMAFSSDGGTALTGGHNRRVCVWDVANQPALRVTLSHQSQVAAAVFCPDGRTILTSAESEEDGCQLWDVRLGKRVGPRYLHTNTIDEVAVSPNGQTALLGGYDGWAVLWRL